MKTPELSNKVARRSMILGATLSLLAIQTISLPPAGAQPYYYHQVPPQYEQQRFAPQQYWPQQYRQVPAYPPGRYLITPAPRKPQAKRPSTTQRSSVNSLTPSATYSGPVATARRQSAATPAPQQTPTYRQGEQVELVQRQLSAVGYDVGTIDGFLGPKTQTALREFQRSKGIENDQPMGSQTLKALSEAGSSRLDDVAEQSVLGKLMSYGTDTTTSTQTTTTVASEAAPSVPEDLVSANPFYEKRQESASR